MLQPLRGIDLQKLLISTVSFDVVERPLLSRWWSSLRPSQLSPVIDALCTSHLHLPVFTAVYASYLISHPEMSQPPPISRHINHPSCHMIRLKSQCTMVPHFAWGEVIAESLYSSFKLPSCSITTDNPQKELLPTVPLIPWVPRGPQ